MKVCYFGIYKESFTRTRVNTMALKSQEIEVISCTDHTPSFKKYINLIKKHRLIRNDYDVMLVGFPGYFTVMLARLLTTKPIIFDAYISYYDGITDRHEYPSWHPRLLYARMVDWISSHCGDVTMVINGQTKKFFIDKLGAPASRMEVLHKGADETTFHPRGDESFGKKEKYRIAWWGSFIPLHGLEYIIDAAALLDGRSDIEFNIIGAGQLTKKIQAKTEALKLKNTRLLGRISDEDLLREIREADITLGLFNSSPKALRCVTNKVYEAMATGKAIITEDSLTNREIFTDKKNVYFVPPGDSAALAAAIVTLTTDDTLRQTIARNALALFRERFTTSMIGVELADIMKRHGILKE